MSTTFAPSPARADVHVSSRVAVLSDMSWVLYAVLFSSAAIVVGLIWDISWHMTVGRDTLWTAPHVLEQIGASVAGLSCGALVLKTTFAGTDEERARSVHFWGFRGPLGAWICIWGALAMISSVPFDDWWHNAYGLDVRIISPPHIVLIAGMMAIQLGTMIMAVGAQNRADAEGRRSPFAMIFLLAAGILVAMTATFEMEYIARPNLMHGAGFYKAAAIGFPLLLLAVARGSTRRWPATTAAGIYMALFILTMWVLQLVPATPKLAPIYNPVTHMVPLPFPVLLILPALALDALLHRLRLTSDWLRAIVAGISFVGIMLVAHWFWAEFMLSSYARNPVFGADQWPYMNRLGEWRYQFWTLDLDGNGNWSPALFARGVGIAVLIAVVSSRVGLAWGKWMRAVRR